MRLLNVSIALVAAGLCPGCSASRHLVDVETLGHPPVRDVRYATTDNFTHTRLYPLAKVFLHRDTARALETVQVELAGEGLGLKIYDGYRPLSVQWRMWNLIHDDRYVSNPAVNRGRHTRGTAVDVTLIDRHGRELPMGTGYDDFTDRAHPDYPHLSGEVKRNRRHLAEVMQRHGFEAYPYEWWHFDLKGWKRYPVMDIAIDQL